MNIVDCRAETYNHALLHCDRKVVARIAKEVRGVFNIDRIIEYSWGHPHEKRLVTAMQYSDFDHYNTLPQRRQKE